MLTIVKSGFCFVKMLEAILYNVLTKIHSMAVRIVGTVHLSNGVVDMILVSDLPCHISIFEKREVPSLEKPFVIAV